ncbi:MAG: hypothetical protein M3R08_09545 [Bacteroidota bacterium]|nr:hypothetical protein [Bacteroidota bacterium]
MVRRFALIAVLLQGSNKSLSSQDTTRAPLIDEVHVLWGALAQKEPFMTQIDWRALVPGSALLRSEALSTMERYGGGGGFRGGQISHAISAGVSINLIRNFPEQTRSKHLRIALFHSPSNGMNAYWSARSSGPLDTLIGQVNGDTVFVDTVFIESFRAIHRSSRTGLDISYVVESNRRSQFSWQIGFGVLAGLTGRNKVAIWHTYETRFDGWVSWDEHYPEIRRNEVAAIESLRVPPSFWGGGYLHFGVGVRLSRSHPFWNSVQLKSEARPSLMLSNFASAPWRTSAAFQLLIGAGIDLHRTGT